MAFKTAEDAAAVAICCSGNPPECSSCIISHTTGFFLWVMHILFLAQTLVHALTGHEIQDLLTIRLPSAPKLKLSEWRLMSTTNG